MCVSRAHCVHRLATLHCIRYTQRALRTNERAESQSAGALEMSKKRRPSQAGGVAIWAEPPSPLRHSLTPAPPLFVSERAAAACDWLSGTTRAYRPLPSRHADPPFATARPSVAPSPPHLLTQMAPPRRASSTRASTATIQISDSEEEEENVSSRSGSAATRPSTARTSVSGGAATPRLKAVKPPPGTTSEEEDAMEVDGDEEEAASTPG